jgi:ABC-type antimicrobial peptide transport system permease subunit
LGVRIALGASPSAIAGIVFRDGLLLPLAGIAAGTGLSFLAARVLGSMVYGVTVSDPIAFVISAATLVTAAAIACALPATRASRIDPVAALRST